MLHEGMALTELGELHRCKGEVALAEQEFSEAYEKGWPPQPGKAESSKAEEVSSAGGEITAEEILGWSGRKIRADTGQ